jgi:hypothetical protein
MPTRDGTGPMGQGSRTGRGMGNCGPTGADTSKIPTTSPTSGGAFRRGANMWDSTFGRFFGRRRGNRMNRQ